MTNPVPTHAPKTDTPYLDARERAEAEDRKMAEKELPEEFGKFPSMDGANFDELSDKLEIVHLRKLVQHEVENRLEERRKKKHVSKLYGESLKKVRELESTLARAIQQRDQFLDEREAAIQDYMAERASRLQADTEQFNAGVEAAALLAEPDTAVRDSDEARMLWKRDWKLAYGIRSLAKPSVSPEQEKP